MMIYGSLVTLSPSLSLYACVCACIYSSHARSRNARAVTSVILYFFFSKKFFFLRDTKKSLKYYQLVLLLKNTFNKQ